MLILGRKLGESIRIGDDIYVRVVRYNPDLKQIILGFTAPTEIEILREEIDDHEHP